MVLGRLPFYGEPEVLPDRSQASSLSAKELVVAYHERTKHHFHRFAASVGYMDWATQPDPFRRYDGASLVRLPFPEMGQALPYWQLYVADSMEPAPLSIDSVSLFCRYAPTEVLGDGRKGELVLCTAWPAQSQPIESENSLQVRKQHLNTLAIAPGLLEGFGPGECPSGVTSVLVDVARDHAGWSVRAALGLEGTRAAIAGASYIPQHMLGENAPRRLQKLAHRADVDIAFLVKREVCPRKGAVLTYRTGCAAQSSSH